MFAILPQVFVANVSLAEVAVGALQPLVNLYTFAGSCKLHIYAKTKILKVSVQDTKVQSTVLP